MRGFPTRVVVTHAYIFLSGRSSAPRGGAFKAAGMLPYRYLLSRVFGGALHARSLSIPARSTGELLRTL